MPFSGLATPKRKFFQNKLRVGYVYIEDSFDTIFNISYGGRTKQICGVKKLQVGKKN